MRPSSAGDPDIPRGIAGQCDVVGALIGAGAFAAKRISVDLGVTATIRLHFNFVADAGRLSAIVDAIQRRE